MCVCVCVCVCKSFSFLFTQKKLLTKKLQLFYVHFRSGSGKSTLLKKLALTAPKKSGLYLINTRGDEAAEYKNMHRKTKNINFLLLNKVAPNSIIFIEDLIYMNDKHEQALRQCLNYDAHHHKIKVFCVSHTVHKNKIYSTLPLFHYIVFTSAPSNLPVLRFVLNFFKFEKPVIKEWSNAFLDKAGTFGIYFCFDCSSMKFYISIDDGKSWSLLKDGEENNAREVESQEVIIKKFEKFIKGHSKRAFASALFSIIIQSKAVIDTVDYTIVFKMNATGKTKKVSLVDYILCLLDESSKRPHVDYKVVHRYLVNKKNVVYPKSFIKNKCFN